MELSQVMGVPPNHPVVMDDHFSIKPIGFLGIPHGQVASISPLPRWPGRPHEALPLQQHAAAVLMHVRDMGAGCIFMALS